ncbi:MAG: metal-dependent transcriptional regulator [Oscillospiraceae bacterium]|nr:metal-dependent transcriptional regulator [Oscillospiraceae bacterium]MDD6084860.1 metal-dependent transcriptional regulator [Oscillospiraceae bacterium]MDY3257547.1 metal-dependent transcriptional regulator [Ruminococcus callidus]
MSKLLESGENYLETILILIQKGKGVRSIDIAEEMGFSKPSISRAVGILKKDGYIEVDSGGFISLTDSGYEIAEKIYERHRVITRFLIKLGVNEVTAAEDACRIEHDISDESFQKLKEHVYEITHKKTETKE